MGDYDRADEETAFHELTTQTEHVLIVCDTEVGTHLVALNVLSADNDYNLYAVSQLREHAQFGVGLESRQHTTCVVVVEELTAKLKIELAIKLSYTLTNML